MWFLLSPTQPHCGVTTGHREMTKVIMLKKYTLRKYLATLKFTGEKQITFIYTIILHSKN